LPVIKITVKSIRFSGGDMSKELSLHLLSNKKSAILREVKDSEHRGVSNVYDLEREILRRKREDAIKRILEDSKSLKW